MKNYTNLIIGIVILLGLAGVVWAAVVLPKQPDRLDDFAKCLKENGATFYGAFWCPHCQDQKADFGRSVQYLPYVECSTPDGQGQLAVCAEAKVESYPTWEFKDGSRETGQLPLSILAEKTGCSLPAIK
jgi:hypothetical protein